MKIAVFPGDGIGTEIVQEAVKVLGALELNFETETALVGGAAFEAYGHPLPDATLKLGFIHYELGRWGDARKTLEDVKTNYPGTSAAQLAETRLQKMKKEGH